MQPGCSDSSALPAEREIEQATVDAQCRDTNGLERVLFEAKSVIQDKVIADSPLVQGFRERIRDAVERAKSYDSPGWTVDVRPLVD